ncbi:MAG: glycosyltransferase family 39 protein [Bryobacteraceae bacterium]
MQENRRWGPYVAALLVCLVFVLLGLLMVQYPGAQYDEVLFISSIHAPAEIEYVAQTPFGQVPLMLMTYVGTLKAAIYAPVLLLAGSGHLTLRLPVLAFGAISIALFFLALRRLTDTRVAILASLLLATDAIYLLTCEFDWGPVALQHLLVTSALYTLVRFVQDKQARWLFAAAFCAGLALWDKALFIWLLAGFSVAALLIYPLELFRLARSPRFAAVSVIGFVLGAAPLLYYNVTHHWRTFAANAQMEPVGIEGKLNMLRRTFDGSGLMGYLVLEDPAGPAPPLKAWEKASVRVNGILGDPRWSAQYYLLIAGVVLAPFLCRRGGARRTSLLLLAGGVLATAIMLSTAGTGGSIHHTVLLWPLPQLMLGLALFALFDRWPGAPSTAAAVVVLVCVASNVVVVNMYLAHFIQNGPALLWTDAVRGLVGDLGRRPGRVVFAADWGMLQQVEYYGEGRIGYHSGSDGIVPGLEEAGGAARLERFLATPNIVYAVHTEGHEVTAGTRKRLLDFASEHGYSDKILNVIRDRHGVAIFEVHEFEKR